jgi:hypothetical protein
MGLSLTFTLLDELKTAAPQVLENALRNIYTAMTKLKTGLLNPSDYKFYSREQILNRHREYLVNLLKDADVSQTAKDYAIKLIVIIGNLRSSGEDYLVAYNLIRDLKLTVNLDSEFSLNEYFLHTSEDSKDQSGFKIDNKGSKEVDLLNGLGSDPSKYNTNMWTFDERQIYMYSMYNGLYRYGLVNTPTSKAGLQYANAPGSYYQIRNPLFLNGKLYVKDDNETDVPFYLYDSRTLEKKESEEFKALLIKTKRKEDHPWNHRILERSEGSKLAEAIQRNEAETYRFLGKTPLFTDGTLIYVMSSHLMNPTEQNHNHEYEWEVEGYDPETLQCSFYKRLILEPEEDKEWTTAQAAKSIEETDYIKQKFGPEEINKHTFATNGKQLAVAIDTTMFFFDLETGRRYTNSITIPAKTHGYNYITNTFWHYRAEKENPCLKSFKIDGFKNRKELNSTEVRNFNEFLKNRTTQTIEEQKSSERIQPRSIEKFLRALGNKPKEESKEHVSTHNKDISNSLYLIMYTMGRGCDEVDKTIQKLDALYPDLVTEKLECQSELFRSHYSITISNNFIVELCKVLEHFLDFSTQKMTDDNLLEQYQFLGVTRLTYRFILTLERLNLQLTSITEDSSVASKLVDLISRVFSQIADPGLDRSQIQSDKHRDEIEVLWHECEVECRAIQNVLINIASESSDDLVSKINELAAVLRENKILPSHRMFLQYLSQSDSLKRILEDKPEMIQNLFVIFEILCDRKAEKLTNHINSLTFEGEYSEIEYNDVDTIGEDIIYSIVQKVLIMVYTIQASISKAVDSDQKKKVETLRQKAQTNMVHYSTAYNKITECARRIFVAAEHTTARVLAEATKHHLEEVKVKENQNLKAKAKYIKYHEHLYEIACEHNRFLDFIHVYVACLASEKSHKMTKNLNNMCRRTIDVLNSFGRYAEVQNTDLEIQDSDNLLKHNLSKDIMKFCIWGLSKIAHSFIKIKESEKKEDENEYKNLLKSKLLSGGIENRFLSSFSKETCQTIENLAAITGDMKLVQYLSKIEKIDEDEILEAIIHEGKDEAVDRLLNLLQWDLQRKNPTAKVGGADGMTFSRCAFAAMLSLNQHEDSCSYTNFVMMVDQLEMSLDMVEGDNENVRNKNLMKELHDLETIQPILDRWQIASKMRIWLQEKKKDISNSVKKKAEAEKRRREEEERILHETDLKQAEEDKDHKDADEEETIDTSSKAGKASQIDEEDLRRKEEEQIKIIIKKVKEKAELLIKIATPASWDMPDTSVQNLRNIDGYTNDNPEENKNENLAQKLQKIRGIQESKGTITSYENLSNKEVFNSCASSVLACLQCTVSAQKIMSAIEQKYVNAMNRYCGLKIMGEVASCYMNDETMTSCFNWFCSALRKNSNILAHYSDGLVGMGEYLLDKCRISFFDIYFGIVKQIRHTTNEETIKFLLNCTKWRIGATDHQYVVKSGIIETLKEGNGDKRREKNPIKYCWGHNINIKTYQDGETLSHIIIDALEFIMMACFSRIVGQDEDKDISLQKTGSAIDKIQQAKSVVNTNITEVLLASSFEVIFIQLTRYSKFIETFDPINWELFVKKRNEMRSLGHSFNPEDGYVFEDEKTQEEIEKEREEEEKKITEEDAKLDEEAKQGGSSRDRIKQAIERQTKKELEKVHTLYDEKVVLKLLRLLEMFTCIALKNDKIHQFVIQVTRPSQIKSIVNLLLNCQSRHGLVALKIFNNLIKIGVEKGVMDEAFLEYKSTSDEGRRLFEMETKVVFEDCPFVQFCYNLLLKIRSSQWDKRSLESYGSYNISCGIMRLLKSILRSKIQPLWREKMERVMDEFLQNTDSYPIEEFDVLIGFFEGGEYEGLNTGSFGKTEDNNQFTAVGFVKRWYDLSTPDGQNSETDFQILDVSPDIQSKDDYLLAIYYDEKHPERNDMFLAIPDGVTLTPALKEPSNDFLLNKTRLNNFLKAMEVEKLPTKNDPISLTKRCTGMKILVEHIVLYGEKIANLFEEDFRNKFINFLLKECVSGDDKKSSLKCEWYEQKLYALKKKATESQLGLRTNQERTISFSNKLLCVSTQLPETNETYAECIKLASALNYGFITQKMSYKILESDKVQSSLYRNDNIAVLKAEEIDTPEKCKEVFKHVDIVVTSDLDLKGLHDKILATGDKKLSYFKSIVLLNHTNFERLSSMLNEGVKIKQVASHHMTDHEMLCEELRTFCNFDDQKLNEIFKDKETEDLREKIKLLADYSNKKKDEVKKEEEKKEDKKEKKEEDEKIEYQEDGYLNCFGLEQNEQLRTNLGELSSYASNNYTSATTVTNQKGDLFSKVYDIKTNDLIGEYINTLTPLYKQLCTKTVSSFFDQLSIEALLEIILTNEESFGLFIKYIQLRGSEAVTINKTTKNAGPLNNFLELLSKIITISSEQAKFSKLNEIIFKKVLIAGTSATLKKALKDKNKMIKDVFSDDAAALKALNLYLVPDVIKQLLKITPNTIYENDQSFMNLFTVLIMIPLTFREEKDFNKQIYLTIYKLLSTIVEKPGKFSFELKKQILSCKILKDSFDKVNFEIKITDYNCLTNEQKILFEIYLLIRQLDDATPEYSSIFSYPAKILEIEKCKIILKEMKKFDMVSYLTYYEKELSEEEKKTVILEQTLHNRYKGKVSAKFAYKGFKKMAVKVHEDSKLEGTSGIGFSTDPEGINIIKKITQTEVDKKDTNVEINSTMFYIHYPYNPPKIMCWGYGYDYRLGNNNSGTTTTAPEEMVNFTKPLKKLFARSGFVVGLGMDKKVYWCGYRSDWGGYKYTMTKYENTMPEEDIIDMRCSTYNCAVLTENHKIYIQGYCSNYHLENGSTKSYFWNKPRPNEEEEKVLDWDVGYNYHIYTTENGKCYAAGNDFLKGIELEGNTKDYTEVKFEEGVIPKIPCCNTNSETYKVALMFVDNKGKSELWSGGYSSYGLLGQGEGKNESKKFAPLSYDKEKLTFVKASIKYYAGMAVTDKGELYAWGSNGSRQIGLPDTKTYFLPTEVPHFKEFVVHEFCLGDYHSMVYASPKNDLEKKQMFLIGDIRGISDTTGKTAEGVLHYKLFDDAKYTWMECGENTFYLGFEGEIKASEGVSVHEGYTCEVTKETPIKGTMHFWKDSAKEWHFASQEGFEKLREESKEIPDICYATKYYIKDIQGREWPEIDANEVLDDQVNAEYPKYFAYNSQGETKVTPVPKADQNGIYRKEACDVNPLIFYRLARPLKKDVTLPLLNLSNYFVESEQYGFKIEISPDYTYEKNDKLIKLQKEKYNKVVKGITQFAEKYDGELLEAIETLITKNGIDFINNPSSEINAADLEFTSRDLKAMAAKDIQPRINAYLEFNKNFLLTIPFVILEGEMIKEVTDGKAEVKGETLSILFMISKHMAFRSIKNSYIKKIADSLPTSYDEPEVPFNRLLIAHKKDKGKIDSRGEWTYFGCVMKALKSKNYESLRKSNSSSKGWRAQFIGMGSYDAGGPFRESLEAIGTEIQSTCLPLLIPTQNHKNDHGLNRDCWTINPSSTSPVHLEMYKFLGALIGMAFRSGHIMDLKFPSIFWKKFIGDPVTLEDLSGSDAYAVQAIRDLEKNKDTIPPDMFVDTMDLSFTTQLSNGETVPVCDYGDKRKVQYDEIDEYHRLILKTRADEGSKQIEAMKEGFELIFPMSILGILSWRDVEERVRGPSEISVAALKSITEYSSCSSDNEFVKRFWRVFEEFTNEERSMFLKFAWGRGRLPPTERLKDQNFKLYLFDQYKFTDHNLHFPEAHTCFFQFDLPRYTTDEACKSKILYAIAACGEIDTDGSSYSLTSVAWEDSD